MPQGHFIWHELATTDAEAAARFYAETVGWEVEPIPEMHYIVLKAAGARVAGIMTPPEHLQAASIKPHWTGYIHAHDVDAKAKEVERAGGTLRYGPDDIPGIGRFAVMTDKDGLPFNLFAPNGAETPEAPAMTPGHVGWNELIAKDGEAAFAFYAPLFGWEKTTPIDMGPMGTYQLYAYGGQDRGGMMTAPEGIPPQWLFYVVVPALDAAQTRLEAAGGTLLRGPMEVPGGAWIINAKDPTGAPFALVSAKR